MAAQSPAPTLQRGIVKQVLSGDTIVVRGPARGGPPPERTVCLSNITAPRLGRRPNPQNEGQGETKDQPFAWEAREFLRKRLIGKEVCFTIEYKVPGNQREYGCVYLGKDTEGENMTELLIEAGLVEVRRGGIRADNEGQNSLIQLEDQAKAAAVGRWGADADAHVRDITWSLGEDTKKFVDSHHQKPVDAVIEHVRDGCTVRAFLLPSFHHVTIMMSGIKCPMFRLDQDPDNQEAYAEEARFFTESRLLQRDVQIILEGVSNQFILGTVLHPKANIQELLLKEGFARCVDWSMGVVTQGTEKLRAAEKGAKETLLRIWKDYVPSGIVIDVKDKHFTAKVTEVVNGDALVVKMDDKGLRKLFLASIRPPRTAQVEGAEVKRDARARVRPLYEIPYMFEAREFLRKKLIGKKVQVQIDYIQPENQGFPEKTCCTVMSAGIDIGEALVSKGYATVIRYRQDDDQRSSQYDELLTAEARAIKKTQGLHSKKEYTPMRVADISGDLTKAKQFLPFLQRAGRMEGLVEFVTSGSRVRLYISSQSCLITFLLSGITCPRGKRAGRNGGPEEPGEPFGDEATVYSNEALLQREVEVEVESMDRAGNFIGYLHIGSVNHSVALVEEGFASVHFTAEKGAYFTKLVAAESRAKETKKRVWEAYVEEEVEEALETEEEERKPDHKTVFVTEVTDEGQFYVQEVDNATQLEQLMEQLRGELTANPPLPGVYTPRKGDMCAALFSYDSQWYRARVERMAGTEVSVCYLDYGNREVTSAVAVAALPAAYHSLPAQAQLASLACIRMPPDLENKKEAVHAVEQDILYKTMLMNVEYKEAALPRVTLLDPSSKEDLGAGWLSEGLVLIEPQRSKRLQKLMEVYNTAQEKAKRQRLCLWQYGDITEDDAKEFGY